MLNPWQSLSRAVRFHRVHLILAQELLTSLSNKRLDGPESAEAVLPSGTKLAYELKPNREQRCLELHVSANSDVVIKVRGGWLLLACRPGQSSAWHGVLFWMVGGLSHTSSCCRGTWAVCGPQ